MRKKLTLWLITAGLISLTASALQAQYQQIKLSRVGQTLTVTDLQGNEPDYIGENGDLVNEQDLIVASGENSGAILVFSNGATITLKENTRVEILQFTQNPFGGNFSFSNSTTEPPSRSNTRIHLSEGELIGNVKSLRRDLGSTFEVITPAGAAGIRGTTFRIVFRPSGDGTSFFTVTTIEGDVGVTPTDGTSPISVTDQQEVEIVVEVNDDTGEVTIITPIADIVPADATPETVAAVTEVVQQAAEAVVEIVLTETTPPAGAGAGDDEPPAGEDDPPADPPAQTKKTALPQTQTADNSPIAGG